MKPIFTLVMGSLLAALTVYGQPLPVELVIHPKTIWYGHSISKNFLTNPRLGFSHVSSGVVPLSGNQPREWMSQSYLSWQLRPGIKLNVGSFYATKPGIQWSAAVQLSRFKPAYSLILSPRTDPSNFRTREIFGILEYKPRLNAQFRFYSRFQFMFNYTKNVHNRSYQYLRLGLQQQQFNYGLAYQFDAYGPLPVQYNSRGIFFRYSFQ